MSAEEFRALIQKVTSKIAGRPVDKSLMAYLNQEFPGDGEVFKEIEKACHEGIKAGLICNREAGGIRFSRVLKPASDLAGFSVDVVDMPSIKGPHHAHPNGEIDMIMPIDETAKFDNHGRGWLVYGPGTAHNPTTSEGRALVLYLLPDGAIEFK